MKTYAYGVDIGGTTIKLGLFLTTGKLIETWEIPTRLQHQGDYILSDIASTIQENMKKKDLVKADVEGVGLGVPGPVGSDGVVYKCVNLGWDILHVEDRMSELLDLKVKAGNDANVAALGEMWQGGGKGYQNLVMITLGTGVGGGVVVNGTIVPGANGAAGEIGHLCMKDDEVTYCGCGKKGCLEQYASATGIVKTFKQRCLEETDNQSFLKDVENVNAKDIFDAAKAGDLLACRVVEETSTMLGKALAQIACVLNPEAFVIGGGVANAGDFLLQLIQKQFISYAFHASRNTVFTLAQLANQAGIYGSVKLLLS